MSDYTAVREVSLALQALLKQEITNSTDPQLSGVAVELNSPKYFREKEKSGISLWLYRVTRQPETLNRPPERVGPSILRRQPMPLTLFYLVTPMREQPKDEQALIGKIVQVFHDHAVMSGPEVGAVLNADAVQLHLALDGLTLEELARVWDVLKEPYQLSLSYIVQTVAIDSDRDLVKRPPVLEANDLVQQIVGESGP